MNEDKWFCVINGKQDGPHSVEALQSMGAATPFRSDMLVWKEGMAEWAPLSATPLAALLSRMMAPPGVPLGASVQAAAHNVGAQISAVAADLQSSVSTTAPGFVDAIKICLAKYADFNGRASRPEFWYFVLFNVIVSLVVGWIPYLGILIALALLLPGIAVGVRRLHDIDRTGWWLLIGFVPLVGFIVLVVFNCTKGTEGTNRFG